MGCATTGGVLSLGAAGPDGPPGDPPVTRTATLSSACKPAGSRAVMVTVAWPRATPMRVRNLRRATAAATTVSSSEAASKVSSSLSGSVTYAVKSSVEANRLAATVCSGISPVCVGARFSVPGVRTVSVTPNSDCRPSGSSAVTCMTTVPMPTPVRVNWLPDTLVVTTLVSGDGAV